MPYTMKPLFCDPARIKEMSERLIISHYENNYGGGVKRLNLIDEQLAQLEFDKTAGFLINGLKREQLIAMNSMILHELFFDGLGEQSGPRGALIDAIVRDFGSFERWRGEFVAMGKALGGGSGWVLLSWSQAGQPMGGRPLPHLGWRHADPCTRYVRALLSHGLRRQSRGLR
jgi:Fe-Mn family superoxide dismutase